MLILEERVKLFRTHGNLRRCETRYEYKENASRCNLALPKLPKHVKSFLGLAE
jgi:hypothetical protein